MDNLVSTVRDLACNPKHTRWIALLILLGEAALCSLIIWKVSCTSLEILCLDTLLCETR